MKKVSIITVCFNSEDSIEKTIKSVLGQTYEAIEYIIVDGKSTDATMEIVKRYEPLFHGRMHYVSEEDRGIYDAMNKGIHMSTGDLIGILNSDDYYEENAVEIMVQALQDTKYQILYGFVRNLKDGKEYSVDRWTHYFLKERMIAHPACFVTKEVYQDFGMYDLEYVSVADYDFMLRMLQQKEVMFVPVDGIITNFVLGGMSSTKKAWLDLLKMQRNHGMISEKEYQKHLRKEKLLTFLHRG